MASDGERIARLEQALADVRDDISEVRRAAAADHHRLRDVEAAVSLMLEAQKLARRAEDRQYRRVANAIAFGGLVMALALVALTAVTIVLHAG